MLVFSSGVEYSWFPLWLQISSGSSHFASALFAFDCPISPENILRRLGLGQSRRSGRWKPGFTADLIPLRKGQQNSELMLLSCSDGKEMH